jgi:adenylate cyclase
VHELLRYWTSGREEIFRAKRAELSNDFKIKALVEENSLIANRLLSSASNEFWRASAELQAHIVSVGGTTRFTVASILVVVLAFAAGNFVVWLVLKRRVFERLARIRGALQMFAESRDRPAADAVADEIGEISGSMIHYMGVIDEREADLARKTRALEQLSNQLAKYLSPQVYDSIFSGRQEVKVTSSRKKLTVFFSDIAGFTETADRLESEELAQLLNQYLTEMSRIALSHGATIDKYVGDAILIFFGDPQTRGVKQDAHACVEMAIAMRRRLRDLTDVWRESGIERPLQVRMGIHTGYCTVGNFGSEDRMDYTIIGGTVNTASRLEAQAEPGEILISYETFAHVKEGVRCEQHGEIEVKGIAYPVVTYRVVDSYENLGAEQRHFREEHPHVKVDLNLETMSVEDRAQAERILHWALHVLSQSSPAPAPIPSRRERRGKTSGDGAP